MQKPSLFVHRISSVSLVPQVVSGLVHKKDTKFSPNSNPLLVLMPIVLLHLDPDHLLCTSSLPLVYAKMLMFLSNVHWPTKQCDQNFTSHPQCSHRKIKSMNTFNNFYFFPLMHLYNHQIKPKMSPAKTDLYMLNAFRCKSLTPI